jgi:hypothetical protein
MSGKIFKEVLYRFNINTGGEYWVYQDYGTLEILQNGIKFTGKKGSVDIYNIQLVLYGRQGRDFFNKWVKIIYGEGKIAFFADGTYQGWGGIFGGTKKLLKAIQAIEK